LLIIVDVALSKSQIAQLTSELSRVPDQRVNSRKVVFNTVSGSYEKEIEFKGEMHALANERTTSSGFLENTVFQVDSGSYKIITENKDKVIENVSNGMLSSEIGFFKFV
jgi:hypothetical protein